MDALRLGGSFRLTHSIGLPLRKTNETRKHLVELAKLRGDPGKLAFTLLGWMATSLPSRLDALTKGARPAGRAAAAAALMRFSSFATFGYKPATSDATTHLMTSLFVL